MSEKSEQNPQNIPLRTDLESGRFVVADILPPRNQNVQLTGSHSIPSKKQKAAYDISVRNTSHASLAPGSSRSLPQKELGNTHAVDTWFRKESLLRVNRSASEPPSSTRAFISFTKKRTFMLGGGLFLALAVGGFGVSYAMSRLEVIITLKTQSHDFDQKISVAVEPTHKEVLAGERIEISDSHTAPFQASGIADVKAKAKGIISVYNAFNTSSQPLVANTRFEAPDGKIYHIRESVVVPAAIVENGVISPRSIDVVVYADEPGLAYNRDLTDFTIPGFRGSSRYTGFYARSKTPMEGGFIGTATVVTKEDLDKARESLESEVRSRLTEALKKSVPEGFLLLDDAIEITSDKREFSRDADEVAKEFSGTITLRGRALVFKKSELEEFLSREAGLDSSLVMVDNMDELTFAIERRNVETGALVLQINGTARFIWNLETDKLTTELVGSQNPGAFTNVFQQYPAIERAEAHFVPSWIRIVPRDPARIQITTNI